MCIPFVGPTSGSESLAEQKKQQKSEKQIAPLWEPPIVPRPVEPCGTLCKGPFEQVCQGEPGPMLML